MYVNPHLVPESREILVTCKAKAAIVLYFYYACLCLNENTEYGKSNDSLICGTFSSFLPDAPLPTIEEWFGMYDLIQFSTALSMPEDFSLASRNRWLTKSNAFANLKRADVY